MRRLGNPKIVRRKALGWALLFLCLGAPLPLAADADSERARLAALVRQLDILARLAEHGASLPPLDGARYHFDYARLRQDIARVRAGIHDYLTPQRAQPRDPLPLIGDYRRELDADDAR